MVAAWWSPARCHHHIGDLVRPDAYLHLTPAIHPAVHVAGRTGPGFEAFVEYDFGTTSGVRVAQKLHRYHHLATLTGVGTPVLFWCPSRHREHHLRHQLTQLHATLGRPDLVPVATASPDPAPQRPTPPQITGGPERRTPHPGTPCPGSPRHDLAGDPVQLAAGMRGAWSPVWRPLTPHPRHPARGPQHGPPVPAADRRVDLTGLAQRWPLHHPPGRALLGPPACPASASPSTSSTRTADVTEAVAVTEAVGPGVARVGCTCCRHRPPSHRRPCCPRAGSGDRAVVIEPW